MKVTHEMVTIKNDEERDNLKFDSYKSILLSLATIAILNNEQSNIVSHLISALATTITSSNNPEKMLQFAIEDLKKCLDIYIKNEATFKA